MSEFVPFIGPRSRYNILSDSVGWIYHKMAGAGTLDGAPPATALLSSEMCDPTVSAGRASWDDLVHGGLFTLLGNYKQPVIVEAVDAAGVTLTLVDSLGNLTRNMPGTFPCKLAPGEYVKAVGGGKVGILVRYDADKIL